MLKKDKIIEIIGNDKIDVCFKELSIHFKELLNTKTYKKEHDRLQLIKAQFQDLKVHKMDGTISFENFNIEKSKIRKSLIEFINGLPEEFWNPKLQNLNDVAKKQSDKEKNEIEESPITIKNPKFKLPYVIILSLLLVGVAYYLFHLYFVHRLDHKNILNNKAWKTQAMKEGAKFDLNKLEIESTICNYAQFVQEVKLNSGTMYTVQYSIKTKDVLEICQQEKAGTKKWGAGIWITNGETQLEKSKPYYGTNKWETGEFTFSSKNTNVAKIYLQLGGFNGLTTGCAQFKNVRIFPKIRKSLKF